MHFFINHVSNVIVWCFFADKILLNKSRDVHFHWYEAFIFHRRPLKESKSYFHWRHLQKENFYHRLNCNIINNIRLYKYTRYFFHKVTEQQDAKTKQSTSVSFRIFFTSASRLLLSFCICDGSVNVKEKLYAHRYFYIQIRNISDIVSIGIQSTWLRYWVHRKYPWLGLSATWTFISVKRSKSTFTNRLTNLLQNIDS